MYEQSRNIQSNTYECQKVPQSKPYTAMNASAEQHKRPYSTSTTHENMFVISIYRYLSLARLWLGPCVILDSLVCVRTCSPPIMCVFECNVNNYIWAFRLIQFEHLQHSKFVYICYTLLRRRPTDPFIIRSLFLALDLRATMCTHMCNTFHMI